MYRFTLRLFAILLISVGLFTTANAQITFSFTYSDSGTGFNDATQGAARRGALESAATTLAGYFTGYTVDLAFTVTSESTNNGTLASAGSGISYSSNGFYNTNVQKLIQTGSGTSDGEINWNFFHTWDYDDDIAGGAYDFKSTAMHEILHAFGFLSYIDSAGKGATEQTSGQPDVWVTFDKFLTDKDGVTLINDTTFAFQGNVSTLTGGSANGVFFNGTNAVAANGGNRVQIYSPDPYESGSSGSHTDDNTFTGVNQLLMNAASETGQGIRTLSAIELGILKDLGYNVVPEPSTYALIFGCGTLLVVMIRRRRLRG